MRFYAGKTREERLEYFKKLAENKGGRCISEKCDNVKIKLKFICKFGHEWEALPTNIYKGKWCPSCSGNKKLTIEYMQEIAKEHGGECLSKEYVNNATPMLWQCQ